MKLSDCQTPKRVLLLICSLTLFFFGATHQLAQNRIQIPARVGHVNDFAGVVDEKTKLQLATLLANLQQKIGIDFAVVTVPSTAGREIFDFSRQVAGEWNVGARTTNSKSLLLVLAVNEKASFTQFSKSVQGDLPEAVLGEMSQRMQALIYAGDFGGGLNAGVHHFVTSMAQKLSLNAADFEISDTSLAKDGSSGKPAEEHVAEVKIPPAGLATRPRVAALSTTTPPPTRDAAIISQPVDQPAPAEKDPVTVAASTKVTVAASRNEEASAAVAKKPDKPADEPSPVRTENAATAKKAETTAEDDADESEEVELTLTLPLEARIARLKEFLKNYPDSKSKSRAIELLVSAHAGLGDQRLQKGDTAGGLELLRLAIDTAPGDMSEQLFSGVIAQIPLNLYLRGERAAAGQFAKSIEAKFGTDAKRLIALSGFYVNTEQADEAVRISNQAITLGPDMAEAHLALGLALHISLRLEEALAEYKRASDLDPNSKAARRGLADLSRGLGKPEEALALYRQLLAADATDKTARAGMVLSLFDLGRTDEAKSELEAAVKADPKNLPLLAGAAYWFVAHGDTTQASDFARKALEVEPRYTWSHVAMARTLVAQRKPLNAERVLRFARQYGKFPTLDYELANALAAAGLFGESSEVLSESFDLKDGLIEARLAGRMPARAKGFLELLAPERRASIFQNTPADNESNAKILRDLLAFTVLTTPRDGALNEQGIIAAAKEFASGNDPAQVYRQLYAAGRLLQKGLGFAVAHELAEAARSTADAGLSVPEVTLAVQADEYRDIRARAIAAGGTPDIAEAPRNVLSNLLRGRIEDISGWALFNQDKLEEAVDHLQRAANILLERTPMWRTSLWHLGAALDRLDRQEEALANYIKSYKVSDPDPARRAVIERLYRKTKGSLAGLDEQIGPAAPGAASDAQAPASSDRTSVPQPSSSPEVTSTGATAGSPAPVAESSPLPVSTPETRTAPEASMPAPPVATDKPSIKPTTTEATVVKTTNPPSETVVSIKGRVFDPGGKGVANVVVILIGPQGTVLTSTTDEEGNYSFSVAPSAHDYRVIPSRDGLTFEPVDRVLPGVSKDQKELNFVGLPKVAP